MTDIDRDVELALAKVGITALVDEATGYQYERPSDELVRLFAEYIDSALVPWCERIPALFWQDLFRLLGLEVGCDGVNRCDLTEKADDVISFIKRVVFGALSNSLLERIEHGALKPAPRDEAFAAALRAAGLTEIVDTGVNEFDYRVVGVGAFLRVAKSMDEFDKLLELLDKRL